MFNAICKLAINIYMTLTLISEWPWHWYPNDIDIDIRMTLTLISEWPWRWQINVKKISICKKGIRTWHHVLNCCQIYTQIVNETTRKVASDILILTSRSTCVCFTSVFLMMAMIVRVHGIILWMQPNNIGLS